MTKKKPPRVIPVRLPVVRMKSGDVLTVHFADSIVSPKSTGATNQRQSTVHCVRKDPDDSMALYREFDLIVPADLRRILEGYARGYVGKWFKITRRDRKKDGRRNEFEVLEVWVPAL